MRVKRVATKVESPAVDKESVDSQAGLSYATLPKAAHDTHNVNDIHIYSVY